MEDRYSNNEVAQFTTILYYLAENSCHSCRCARQVQDEWFHPKMETKATHNPPGEEKYREAPQPAQTFSSSYLLNIVPASKFIFCVSCCALLSCLLISVSVVFTALIAG